MISNPIDKIWILGGFQPSVHSETASSATFYLWVWKMTFFIFENPGIRMAIYIYTYVYIYIYTHMYMCMYIFPGAPNSPEWALLFRYLWPPQSRYYVYTGAPRVV